LGTFTKGESYSNEKWKIDMGLNWIETELNLFEFGSNSRLQHD
jgi:hypothetical protein